MPTLTEPGSPLFFCHSFSRALLRAHSCVLQLRGFCFPGSSLNAWVPPIKQPLALQAAALVFGCPRKWGRKRRHFHVLVEHSNDRRICLGRPGATASAEQRFKIHRSFRRHAAVVERLERRVAVQNRMAPRGSLQSARRIDRRLAAQGAIMFSLTGYSSARSTNLRTASPRKSRPRRSTSSGAFAQTPYAG